MLSIVYRLKFALKIRCYSKLFMILVKDDKGNFIKERLLWWGFYSRGDRLEFAHGKKKWGFIGKDQSGGLWMKNYQEEISGVWKILAKPTWWDSWWRQARVIRYSMWGMRNLIRYRGDKIPRVRGFSLNDSTRFLLKLDQRAKDRAQSRPGRQRAKRICMRLWLRRESLWWWDIYCYL